LKKQDEREKTMAKKAMYDCKDVMEIANVKKDMAWKIIRELNTELKASGYIIRGRIPATYLIKRLGIDKN
jgi:hypothetical protein